MVSSALGIALVFANYSRPLVAMYTGMILLSSVSALVALVFMTMAEVVLLARTKSSTPRAVLIALGAFGYGLIAISGAGHEAVSWGFLLLLGGLPIFVFVRR